MQRRGGEPHLRSGVHCSDGRTPLTEDNYEVQASRTFTITPMVEGYPPQSVNIFSLDGNCASFLQDGRAYYVMDTEDVQMFADHTVYLAVYQGFVPSYKEFSVAGGGTIAMREDVVGCMFTLPLDPALADPEAVQAFLEEKDIATEPLTDEELKALEQKTSDVTATESLAGLWDGSLSPDWRANPDNTEILRTKPTGAVPAAE